MRIYDNGLSLHIICDDCPEYRWYYPTRSQMGNDGCDTMARQGGWTNTDGVDRCRECHQKFEDKRKGDVL